MGSKIWTIELSKLTNEHGSKLRAMFSVTRELFHVHICAAGRELQWVRGFRNFQQLRTKFWCATLHMAAQLLSISQNCRNYMYSGTGNSLSFQFVFFIYFFLFFCFFFKYFFYPKWQLKSNWCKLNFKNCSDCVVATIYWIFFYLNVGVYTDYYFGAAGRLCFPAHSFNPPTTNSAGLSR